MSLVSVLTKKQKIQYLGFTNTLKQKDAFHWWFHEYLIKILHPYIVEIGAAPFT